MANYFCRQIWRYFAKLIKICLYRDNLTVFLIEKLLIDEIATKFSTGNQPFFVTAASFRDRIKKKWVSMYCPLEIRLYFKFQSYMSTERGWKKSLNILIILLIIIIFFIIFLIILIFFIILLIILVSNAGSGNWNFHIMIDLIKKIFIFHGLL